MSDEERKALGNTTGALRYAELALELAETAKKNAASDWERMKLGDLVGTLRAAVHALEGALAVHHMHQKIKPTKTTRRRKS